jgi:hypothetical protein
VGAYRAGVAPSRAVPALARPLLPGEVPNHSVSHCLDTPRPLRLRRVFFCVTVAATRCEMAVAMQGRLEIAA